MLEFACPECSQSVRAGDDQAGESIICPKCNQTIRVPGSGPQSTKSEKDDWSLFDEDEKFIEESVAQQPDVKYRTAEDDREALIDDDAEAVKQEELEERAAVAEALERNRSQDFGTASTGSSELTVDEQLEQEAKFQKELESLPEDSPLRKKKSWDREAVDSPDTIRLENQPGAANSISARCPVCESVTMVSENKAGREIVCSDCGTNIKVPNKSEQQEEKADKKQDWEKWVQQDKSEQEKKQKSKIVDELFVVPPEDEEEEYGLAPATDPVVTPLAPIIDSAEADDLLVLDFADDPPAEQPANVDAADEDIQSSQYTLHLASSQQAEPTESDTRVREPAPHESSQLFEEMEADRSVKFERLPWAQHVFGIMSDPGFLLRAVAVVIAMTIGFTIFHFSSGYAEMEGGQIERGLSFFGKLVQVFSFPFIPVGFLMICWVGQKVLDATIVGEKKLPDLEGGTFVEWISSTFFVAVGMFIGGIPGAMFGGLLLVSFQFEELQGFWFIPAFATASAMVVAPMIILSSLENRSPFKIFSKKISDSVRKKSDAWIEFYLPALGLAVVTGSLWLLVMTEIWFVAVLAFLLVNLGLGLYFRMLGRLMGTIIHQSEKKKKSRKAWKDDGE